MPSDLARLLRQTVESELPFLNKLSEAESAIKPDGPVSWSPKEELGHLIDSAVNNHGRFVRAALEPEYRGPGYAQDNWVNLHAYQQMTWSYIVDFWGQYNYFIAGLVEHIPQETLGTNCHIGSNSPVTLSFLIDDYVLHMRHHIDHLLQREEITVYPRVTAPAA
jgi:hypothetical protein